MPGKGDIKLTGKLGEVIRESAQIGLSWVKSHAYDLGITSAPTDQFMNEIDVHVRVRTDEPDLLDAPESQTLRERARSSVNVLGLEFAAAFVQRDCVPAATWAHHSVCCLGKAGTSGDAHGRHGIPDR